MCKVRKLIAGSLALAFFTSYICVPGAQAGQLEFDGVPVDITTAAGEDLVILPGTDGTTQIGSGTSNSNATSNNDLYVSGILEVDGTTYADGGILAGASVSPSSNESLDLGSSSLSWRNAYVKTLYAGDISKIKSLSYSFPSVQGVPGTVLTNDGSGNLTWTTPATLPEVDTVSIVKGSGDATKQMRFEVDGLTTASTRVITVPDRDGTLVLADASGNVGIGTSVAEQKLEVTGALKATSSAAADTGAAAFFDYESGGARILSKGSDATTRGIFKLSIMESDEENALNVLEAQADGDLLLAQSSGNVGIGTSNPAQLLHLSSQSATGTIAQIDSYDTAAPTPAMIFRSARLTSGATSASQADDVLGAVGGRGYGTNAFSDVSRVRMNFHAAENWTNTAQGTYITFDTTTAGTTTRGERMRIAASGNVGIGTTNPLSPLHVQGDIRIGSGSSGQLVFADGTTMNSASVGAAGSVSNIVDAVITGDSDANGTGGVLLKTGSNTRLTVLNDGNVGLGTTNPGSILEVQAASPTVRVQTTAAGNPELQLRDSTGTPKSWFAMAGAADAVITGTAAGDTAIRAANGQKIHLSANGGGASHMTVLSSGNIGIGTTSPTYGLEIKPTANVTAGQTVFIQDATPTTGATKVVIKEGASQSTANIPLFQIQTTSGAEGFAYRNAWGTPNIDVNGRLNVGPKTTIDDDMLRLSLSGRYGFTNDTVGAATMDTAIGRNAAGVVEINNGTAGQVRDLRVRALNPAGESVGIGTTTPGQLLHVFSTAADDNGGHIKYENANTGTGAATNAQIIGKSKYGTLQNMVWEDKGARIGMRSMANGGVGDLYLTAGSDSVKMTVGASGNVTINSGNLGIGTTNPAVPLSVYTSSNGAIHVTRTDNTKWLPVDFWPNGTLSASNVRWGEGMPGSMNSFSIWSNDGSTDTHRLLITNSGNVGIGTTDPAYKLDVSGDVNVTGAFRVNGTPLISGGQWTTVGNDIHSSNSGNVGIGTTGPVAKLEVAATTPAVLVRASGGFTGKSYLRLGATSAANFFGMYLQYDGAANALNIGSHSFSDTDTANDVANFTVLRNSGNVGIGTTNPAARLAIQANADDDVFGINAYKFLKWNSDSHLHFGGYTASQWTQLGFWTSGAQRLTINSAGNVGIGNSNPSLKLSVAGETETTGLHVSTGAHIDSGGQARLRSAGKIAWTSDVVALAVPDTELTRSAAGVVAINGGGGDLLVRALNPTTGNVGIGTNAPGQLLHLSSNAATGTFAQIDSFHADTPTPAVILRSARGTAASPTASQADDVLGAIGARGYGTNAFASASKARINFHASENWTNTAQGTYMSFDTTASGGTTRSEIMRITQNGRVGIGSTDPGQKLSVAGTIESTSGGFKFPDGTTQTTSAAGSVSGTLNYISKFTSATALGNSLMFDNGTNIGIGTTVPGYKLEVVGDINSSAGYRFQGVNLIKKIGTNNSNLLIDDTGAALGASAANNIFIGQRSGENVNSVQNVMVGNQTGMLTSTGQYNTYVGQNAGVFMNGSGNTFLGYNSGSAQVGSGPQTGSSNTGLGAVTLGALTSGIENVAVGYGAGYSTNAGSYNIFLGKDAHASAATNSSIAIGYNATATANNQLLLGSADANGAITDAYIGSGVTKASPVAVTINATGGSGADNAGANLQLAGGKGTGTGAGGNIVFRTAPAAGASASTLNALVDRVTITSAGNVGIGTTAPTTPLTIAPATVHPQIILKRSDNDAQQNVVSFVPAGTLSNSNLQWNVMQGYTNDDLQFLSWNGSAGTVEAALDGDRFYVNGIVESTSGGFKFPDGTTQTTSAAGTVSGTTNYVSKFTSGTAIGNSLMFDNGTSVGIGTTSSPAYVKLELSGGHLRITQPADTDQAIQFTEGSTVTSDIFVDAGENYLVTRGMSGHGLRFLVNGAADTAPSLQISPAGNLSIGHNGVDAGTIHTIRTGQTSLILDSLTSGDSALTLRQDGTMASDLFYSRSQGKLVIRSGANKDMTFYTNGAAESGTPQMIIKSDGNVGIGTTNPAGKLDVFGITNVRNDNIGSASTDGIALINATAATSGQMQYSPRLRLSGQGWKQAGPAVSETVDWAIQSKTTSAWAFAGADLDFSVQHRGEGYQSRMVLTSGGSLSMTGGLDVAGAANVTGNLTAAGVSSLGAAGLANASPLTVTSTSATSQQINFSNMNTGANAGVDLILNTKNTDGPASPMAKIKGVKVGTFSGGTASTFAADLAFETVSNAVVDEKMRILAGGNVGIGTTSPASKLTVAGLIESTASGFKFPDGTIQTTATGAGATAWTVSGNNIYNSNSGNVGIGTTAPNRTFTIKGSDGDSSIIGVRGGSYEMVSIGSMGAHTGRISLSGGGTEQIVMNGDGTSTFNHAMTVGTNNNTDKITIQGADGSDFLVLKGTGYNFLSLGSSANHTGRIAVRYANTDNVILDGTGTGYFANNLGIGTTSPASPIDVRLAMTASGGVARGAQFVQTLTAAANNDTLTALRIAPTFTNGSYTGVSNYGLLVESGFVGIGTAAPGELLHLSSNAAGALIQLDNFNAAPVPALVFRSARGTAASPTASQSDDFLGGIGARGYGANAFSSASKARINFLAAENWTNAAQGTHITFDTTASGGTTRSEIMRVTQNGRVGIGSTDPGQKLSVAGTIESTSGGFKFPDGTTQTSSATTAVSGTANYLSKFTGANAIGNSVIYETGGNIGIGTTNPGSKLAIDNSGSGYAGGLFIKAGHTANGGFGIGLQVTSIYDSTPYLTIQKDLVRFSTSGGVLHVGSEAAQNGGYANNAPLNVTTSDSNGYAAIISNAGTYGSGLHVSGGATIGGGRAALTVSNRDGIGIMSAISNDSGPAVIFGSGDGGGTPVGGLLRAAAGGGTDITGSNLTLAAGNGTGTGGSGKLFFQTAPAGSTGTTANTLATRMTIDNSGKVGIGTISPQGTFEIAGAEPYLNFVSGQATGWGGAIRTRLSRGTVAAPTIVNSGDEVGTFVMQGHDGTAYRSTASIRSLVDGTPGANDMPGRLEFYTTPDGSVVDAVRMTIKNDGNVGIGSTAPGQKLTVAGTVESTSGGFKFPDGTTMSTAASGTASGTANYLSKFTGASTLGNSVLYETGGNIGIGTTNPTSKLHVVGLIQFANAIDPTRVGYIGKGVDDASMEIHNGSGGITIQSANTIAFNTWDGSYLERMRINYLGQVGIGTNAPGELLHVSSNAAGAIIQLDNFNAAPVPALVFRSARGTQASPTASQAEDFLGGIGARGYGADAFSTASKARVNFVAAENWTNAAQGAYISFDTTAAGGTTRSEKMRINHLGYVGIGTTNPGELLRVQGNPGGSGVAVFAATTGAPSSTPVVRVLSDTSPSEVEIFQIRRDGNVGIGTNNPGYKLHVAGDVNVTGNFKINGTNIVQGGQWTTSGNNIYSANSGNVGIGETAPGSKLAVSGGMTVGTGYDTTTAPANGMFIEGNVGIGTTDTTMNYPLRIATNASGGLFVSNFFGNGAAKAGSLIDVVNSSGAKSAIAASVVGPTSFDSRNGDGYAGYFGGHFGGGVGNGGIFVHNNSNVGGSTIPQMEGVRSFKGLANGVTVTNAIGFISDGQATATDVITNLYDFRADNFYGGNSGTITNRYGLYLGFTKAVSQSTNAYGIYQSGTDVLNYFAGNVGIGTTAPGQLLEVSKNQNASTVARVLNTTNGTSALAGLSAGNGTVSIGMTYRPAAYTDDPLLAGAGVVRTDSAVSGGLVLSAGGANNLKLFTNDTEKMRILSGGNVGIGSTDPQYKLDVAGDINFTGTLRQGGAAFTGSQWTSGSGLIYYSGGNVGIGTATPNTSLSVYNPNESTTVTDITQALDKAGINIITDYTAGAYTPGVIWSTPNNNPTKPKAGIYMLETNGGTALYFGTSNSYVTGLTNGFSLSGGTITADAEMIALGTGASRVMGSLGVGVAPSTEFHIKGGLANPTVFQNADLGTIHVHGSESAANSFTKITFDNEAASGEAGNAAIAAQFTASGSKLLFGTSNVFPGLTNTALVIDQNGNLGVGTVSPATKLDVEYNDTAVNGVSVMNAAAAGTKTYTLGVGTAPLGNDGDFVIFSGTTPVFMVHSQTDSNNVSLAGAIMGKNASEMQVLSMQNMAGAGNIGIALGRHNSAGGLRWTSGTGSLVRVGDSSLSNTGTFNPSSGTGSVVYLDVTGTIEQSGTATGNYTGLKVNMVESAFLGTDGRLIDAQSGGVSRFVVKNTGKVGIGTTDPLVKFQINDAANASMNLKATGTGGLGWMIGSSDNSWGAGGGKLLFLLDSDSSASSKLAIQSNGNVGIGSTAPEQKLTVNGTIKSTSGGFMFPDGTTMATAASGSISGTASYVPKFTAATTLGNSLIYDDGDKVGVGTTSPNAKLFVLSASNSYPTIGARAWNGQTTSLFDLKDSSDNSVFKVGPTGTVSIPYYGDDGSIGAKLFVSGGNDTPMIHLRDQMNETYFKPKSMVLRASLSASGTPRAFGTYNIEFESGSTGHLALLANGTGNVGIGTTAPAGLLHLHTAAASDQSIRFSEGDVAHGMTSIMPTDTYAVIQNANSTSGGLEVVGASDADTSAVTISAMSGAAPVTNAAMLIDLYKKSGTGRAAIAGTELGLQVRAGTSPVMTVLGSGNVGIGTTAPGALLDASSPNAGKGVQSIVTNGSGSKTAAYFQASNGGDDNVALSIAASGATNNKLIVTSASWPAAGANNYFIFSESQAKSYFAGNIGIGTSAPADAFHVSSNAATGTLTLIDSYATAPVPALVFRSARGTQASPTASQADDFLGGIGSRGYGATGFSSASKARINFLAAENWTDSAQGTYIAFDTTAAGGTTRSEKMRINSAGNVGIGTTTPNMINWAAGNTVLTVKNSSGSNNRGILELAGNQISAGSSSSFIEFLNMENNSSVQGRAYVAGIYEAGSTLGLSFGTTDTGSAGVAARMRITGSGNVGIGTTAPTNKLEVAGNIKLTSGGALYFPDGSFMTTAGGGSGQWTTAGSKIHYNAGNVGIGSTDPQDLLELDGNSTASKNLRISNAMLKFNRTGVGSYGRVFQNQFASGPAAANGMMLAFGGEDDFINNRTSYAAAVAPVGIHLKDGAVNFVRAASGSSGAALTWVSSATIDASGNLGIGTTAPGATLGLGSGSTNVIRFDSGGSNDAYFKRNGAYYYLETGANNSGGGWGFKSTVSGNQIAMWTGDINTGTADTIFIGPGFSGAPPVTGSGSTIVLKSSGSVGIGTTSPSSALHVYSGGTAPTLKVHTNNSVDTEIQFIAPGGAPGGSIEYTMMTENMGINVLDGFGGLKRSMDFQNRTGNIGIGTTNPSGLGDGGTTRILHIDRSDGYGLLMLSNGLTANDQANGVIYFGSTGLSDPDKRMAAIVSRKTDASVTTPKGNLEFWTANGAVVTERMRITEAGNVGIGTTAPQQLLHVQGANAAAGNLFTQVGYGNIPSLWVGNSSATDNNWAGIAFTPDNAGTVAAAIGVQFTNHDTDARSTMNFATHNGSSQGIRMTIDKDGSVGIGTTVPANMLHIYGSNQGIRMTETGSTKSWLLQNSGSDLLVTEVGVGNHMTFQAGGNIGIGSASPAYRLDVNGAINATAVKVNGVDVGAGGSQWTSGSGLIYYNGGNVGIGTTNPAATLEAKAVPVAGEVQIRATSSSGTNASYGGYQARNTAGNALYLTMGDASYTPATYYAKASWGTLSGSGGVALRFGANTRLDDMVIDTSGNVGIGTTNPQYKVSLGAGGDKIGYYDDASHNASIELYNAGTANMNFQTTNASGGAFTFMGGNVGIGTTAPAALLDVNGRNNAQYFSFVGAQPGGLGASKGILDFSGGTSRWFSYGANTSTAGIFQLLAKSSNESVAYTILASDTSGNVGIGTAIPGQRLEVAGLVRSNGSTSLSGFQVLNNGSDSGGMFSESTWRGSGSSNNLAISAYTGNKINFFHNGGSTEAMTIDANGRIGIGSTAPGYALDVVGDVNVTGNFKVNGVNISGGSSQWTTAGSEIYFNNNVGIGTTDPATTLHLYGADVSQIVESSGAADTELSLKNSVNEWQIYTEGTGPSAGFLKFWDDGDKFTIDTSGKVGIGTTAPSNPLHIVSDTTAPIAIGGTTDTSVFELSYESNTSPNKRASLRGDEGFGFFVGSTFSGTEKLRIDSTGNVGIGTTNPTAVLEVQKSQAAALSIAHFLNPGLSSGNNTNIYFGKALADGQSGSIHHTYNSTTDNSYVSIGNWGDAVSSGTGLIIKKGGNVGIGTTNPAHELDIVKNQDADTVMAVKNFQVAVNAHSVAYVTTEAGGGDPMMRLAQGGSGPDWYVGVDNSDGDKFKIGGGAEGNHFVGNNERLIIDTTGKVGIGSASPAYTLDVAGDVNVTGSFRVNGTPISGSGQWTTAGSEIYFSDNVGIGTTNPAARLDISGSQVIRPSAGNWNEGLSVARANTSAAGGLYLHTGTAVDDTTVKWNIGLAGDGATEDLWVLNKALTGGVLGRADAAMRIKDTTGNVLINSNVGIGTTNPAQNFEVWDSANTINYGIFKSSSTGSSAGSAVSIEGDARYTFMQMNGSGNSAFGGANSFNIYGNSEAITFWNSVTPTERMRITSTGNVGIGSNNPGRLLDVNGTARFTQIDLQSANRLSLENQVNDHAMNIFNYGTTGASSLRFQSPWAADKDTNVKMTILGTGNVGIGTTAPASKLTVSHNDNGTATQFHLANTGTGRTGLTMGTSNGTVNADFAMAPDEIWIRTYQSIPMSFYTANAPRLTILGNGNVGVGTSNPGYKFDVAGDVNISGTFRVNGTPIAGGGGQWTTATNNIYSANTGNVGIGTSNPTYKLEVSGSGSFDGNNFVFNNDAQIWNRVLAGAGGGTAGSPIFSFLGDTNTGAFRPGNDLLAFSTAGAEAMRIDASGNVGIGSTTPGAKLDVRTGTGVSGSPLSVYAGLYSRQAMAVLETGIVQISQGIEMGGNPLNMNGAQGSYINSTNLVFANAQMTNTGNDIQFGNRGMTTEYMRIKDTGNVGIGTTGPNSTLQVGGSMSLPIVSKTAAYTATASDYTILCNATGGGFTITLPTASGIAGRLYVVKKTDTSGNNVTIDPTGSETVDGSATTVLNFKNESVTVQSDGTNWVII